MNTHEFSTCQTDLTETTKSDHIIVGRQFPKSYISPHLDN